MAIHALREHSRATARTRGAGAASSATIDWYEVRLPAQGEHPVASEAGQRLRGSKEAKGLEARIDRLRTRLQKTFGEQQATLFRELFDSFLERELLLRREHYNIGFEAGRRTHRAHRLISDARATTMAGTNAQVSAIRELAAEIGGIARHLDGSALRASRKVKNARPASNERAAKRRSR
jgi:hypothetical protein